MIDKNVTILVSIVILLLVNIAITTTSFLLTQHNIDSNKESSEMTQEKTSEELPIAETHNNEHDFGLISKKDGKVSTTFEIENHGKGVLKIGNISTSCGCTSATIDQKELGFNEETELTVVFDPNFHEEPKGMFKRSIYVETNDPEIPELVFNVYVDIKDN